MAHAYDRILPFERRRRALRGRVGVRCGASDDRRVRLCRTLSSFPLIPDGRTFVTTRLDGSNTGVSAASELIRGRAASPALGSPRNSLPAWWVG